MNKNLASEGIVTAVVDAPERAPAVEVFGRLCRAVGIVPSGPVHWEPYPKLGLHSLIECSFVFPGVDLESAIAELDRLAAICAEAPVGYDPDSDHSRTLVRYRDGAVDYSRTIDSRVLPFRIDGLVWLELRARID